MRSPIRWAGSKRLLVKTLGRYWPADGRRYVEPFAGSASLFFTIQPANALLADLNEELITTYTALRRDPMLVLQCLRRLPLGRRSYYAIRAAESHSTSDAQIAARFLYLNRYCFNGLYRTNSAGAFNVPYGPPKQPLIDFESCLLRAAAVLRAATVKAQDFEATLSEVRPGDFVYMDPPYAIDDRRVFREYLPGSFTRADLERLRYSLKTLDTIGAVFLLSYAASPEARTLLSSWSHRRIATRRHVAGFAGDRRRAYEYLISNRPLHRVPA